MNTVDDPLLASAISILKSSKSCFEVRPWREIMPSATAKVKTAEMKAAAKRIAARGILPPKHTTVSTEPVIESHSGSSATVNSVKEAKMAKKSKPKSSSPVADTQTEMFEPAESADVKTAKQALTIMQALHERVKAGAYVKSTTGQLRCDDDLARALDAVPADNVVKLAMIVLEEPVNKYAGLNLGQQSMNYRNRLRGAVRKGTVTLDHVIALRDLNEFATGHADLEAKAAKKAAIEAERAAKKAAKKSAKKVEEEAVAA